MMRIEIAIFSFLIFSLNYCYSQTEYNYYEEIRKEREIKKVKTISEFGTFNDALEKKDYFDEQGYLRKREYYISDLMGENSYVWKEISSIIYDSNGNISGEEINYESNKEILYKSKFSNISPSKFYDIGFGETTVEEVKYFFDKKNRLIEKKNIFGDDVSKGQNEKEIFKYDKNDQLMESKFYSGTNPVSITKYFYTSSGLLDRIEVSYDFQNGGRNYGARYEYEFY